jgi:general secretion pathway protein A
MSYYKIIGLDKEPFSTSPDPDFLYMSKGHETVMVNTLIELRLRRGLSVILGDVGTGKTTLSRKLIQELRYRQDCIFHMVLDPSFDSDCLFLDYLARSLEIPFTTGGDVRGLKESLERFLFQKGVIEGRTVVLIIDEAQKLSQTSLELLRVLLNYETNEFKLLQLVLLGQLELNAKIKNIPNFFDRISFKYTLNPLTREETREMIEFRIRQAGYRVMMHLFLDDAIEEIYNYTKGYPRRINMLCHTALKQLILKNKPVVDGRFINEIIANEIKSGWQTNSTLVQNETY